MDKKIDAFFSPLFFLGRWRWKETISLTFKLPRALRGLPFHTSSCLILPANTMLSSNIWENSGQEKNFFFSFLFFPFQWLLEPVPTRRERYDEFDGHAPPSTDSVVGSAGHCSTSLTKSSTETAGGREGGREGGPNVV